LLTACAGGDGGKKKAASKSGDSCVLDDELVGLGFCYFGRKHGYKALIVGFLSEYYLAIDEGK
jgi:hypothetical protein